MTELQKLCEHRVFHYFREISAIHRGSGDMDAISQYCIDFANTHNLKYYTDDNKNVVIFKDGCKGLENAQPVIFQGHLDMVCQKTPDSNIDFLKDGIDIYVDGDYIKAHGTTLGADNGIAVAMVLAILESDTITHPPIEAVFTTDEETGMYGARAIDTSVLKGKSMINLDSEEDDCVTVSCAGGSDLRLTKALSRTSVTGDKVTLKIEGLKGGHSGVEINKGRTNANILAGEMLSDLSKLCEFELISINGGDKPNAIPNCCLAELCVKNAEEFLNKANQYLASKTDEVKKTEENFYPTLTTDGSGEYKIIDTEVKDKLIYSLTNGKNGVQKMSDSIENLVETSLNLGILSTNDDTLLLHYSLRSNKNSGLFELEKDRVAFFEALDFETYAFGHYPPWEYKENSKLRDLYIETYIEKFNKQPRVEALHAGLECGVFASAINDIDCIAIGPTIYDVHTVNEKLSITSTLNLYDTLVKLLAKMQ